MPWPPDLRCELVSHKSPGAEVSLGLALLTGLAALLLEDGRRLCDLEQREVGVHVPDLEPGEVDPVDVGLGRAQVILGDPGER